jgi:oligogalacturonide lyase
MNQNATIVLPWERDRETGRRMRRVSTHESINHHPFFYVPAYDASMRWLFYVSHETGAPQAYGMIRPEGRAVRLTNCPDLCEWSIHPSSDGRYLYYTRGSRACRVDLESFLEECLHDFGSAPMVADSMVGAGMGVTTVSFDDRWWAIPVRTQACSRLYVFDTSAGDLECVHEAESIFHPQFHPDDPTLLHYSGPHTSRMWVINRDGTGNRLVYERDALRKEWVVHESWIPGTRDLLAVDWPRGLFRVSIDDSARSEVSGLNAWHPIADRTGKQVVTDTRNPDRGICLLRLSDRVDKYEVVCSPRASSRGDHWDCAHCPYDDGPVQVYAPQHTHPHPSISPDGRYIVFTTDVSGWPTVYEFELEVS